MSGETKGKEEEDHVPGEGEGAGEGAGEAEVLRTRAEADGLLTWADLDADATRRLLAVPTDNVEEQYRLLGESVGVKQYDVRPRRGILLDFMFYNLQFAQEVGFNEEQTSAFFSVMKNTLAHAGSEGAGSWLPLEASFEHFKTLFLAHSVPSASGGAPVFTVDDVRRVTGFVTKSFYRHYAAYKVVFTEKQPVEDWARDAVVETPMRPPPLQEATLE